MASSWSTLCGVRGSSAGSASILQPMEALPFNALRASAGMRFTAGLHRKGQSHMSDAPDTAVRPKRDWQDEYWVECVECGADECGAVLTQEQVEHIAATCRGGHENYGMASGNDVATANWHGEQRREKEGLLKQLQREREKVHCRVCDGRGREINMAGPWRSDSQCWKCKGDGRHDP
jgi:hypothetical protein